MTCKFLNLKIGENDVKGTCMLDGERVPMNCSCAAYEPKDMSKCDDAIINNCYEFNPTGYSNM